MALNDVVLGREYAAMRTTLDYLARQLALRILADTGKTLQVAEVEDVAQYEAVLKDGDAAVIFQLVRFEPAPRAPRFQASFNIGIKTKEDNGNLSITKYFDVVQSVFSADQRFPVNHYKDNGDIAPAGAMLVIDAGAAPQAFDKSQGLRMLSCRVAAVLNRGS